MSKETRIFVDGGCSIHPEDEIAVEAGVQIVPLDVKFLEGKNWVSYQGTELSADEFYRRMRESSTLPQTSGAISGRLVERFQQLPPESQAVSVHITSQHSVSYESGMIAKNVISETRPDLLIEVLDSKSLSLGGWFLVEQAAVLARGGASIEEIKDSVLSNIPKVDVFAMVANLNNLVKGGRVSGFQGFIGGLLQMNPIMVVENGKVTPLSKPRTVSKAKKELVSRVENTSADIVRLGVLHTNGLENALEVKEAISAFYDGEIIVREAGPVFGVHLGEGGVGVALLTK